LWREQAPGDRAPDGDAKTVVQSSALDEGSHAITGARINSIAKKKTPGIPDFRAHGLSRPSLTEHLAITLIHEIDVAT
jgi:allantoinase